MQSLTEFRAYREAAGQLKEAVGAGTAATGATLAGLGTYLIAPSVLKDMAKTHDRLKATQAQINRRKLG